MESISGQLYKYLQSVQAYISPPIAAVFLLGIFSKRLNGRGAMAALLTGAVLGLTRLALEINKSSLSGFWFEYADINFLHFAVILFIICSVVLIVVSMTAPPPSEEQIDGLTYETAGKNESDPVWRRKDAILSVILVAAVCLVWWYFSG